MLADFACPGRRPRHCGRRPEGPPSAGGYLPIEEHGVIGDLHTTALVGAEGTIDWHCPGRIDGPSVFGALLDARRGGHWSLCPAGGRWRSRQYYLPDTNVLVTRFMSREGELELEDFMAIGATPATLVRRVVGVRGEPHLVMEVEPRFDLARRGHEVHVQGDGVLFESDGQALSLHAPLRLRRTRAGVQAKFRIGPGEVLTLGLSPDGPPALAGDAFEETIAFWRGWLAGSGYDGPWRETVHRSALALKLLTSAASGGPDAARAAQLLRRLGLEDDSGVSPAGRAGSPNSRSEPLGLAHAAFRAAEQLARARRVDEARLRFEQTLIYANPLGLLSQEVDPGGEQLGHFPHAATHVALISAALTLAGLIGPARAIR
jgi:GH15 family glucan-1,4-alpha-glucosidase